MNEGLFRDLKIKVKKIQFHGNKDLCACGQRLEEFKIEIVGRGDIVGCCCKDCLDETLERLKSDGYYV